MKGEYFIMNNASLRRIFSLLLAVMMVCALLPTAAFAEDTGSDDGIDTYASNSTVVLHPSNKHTATGVKVKVGDLIDGHPVTSISSLDVTIDLGKYNVNNDTFRLPYAKDIWYGVDDNKVDYISWAGSGSNSRSEGGSALLANGKNTAYYYFNGAPNLPTFTLNYDANGGTGAPASQTHTATSKYEGSYTFTISSQVPTREGYTFLGWSTNPNATTADRQPGGSIVVTGTTTLYAVWETKTPPQPDKPGKPTEDDIINNNILGDVTVECTNADVQHGSKSYPLTKESITSITEPVYDSNAGQYSCMVTVSSTGYVHQFDRDKGGVHTPDDRTKTIQLLYYADAWHGPSGDPSVSSILFKVACTEKPEPPKAPDAPSHDKLSKLIGDITVNCTNDAATHTPKSKGYALIADSYTRGTVVENTDGGYTYAVTIKSEKYVNQFDTDTGSAHTPKDDEATVVLEYKDKAWAVKSGKPVSFNVACVTEIVPPEKPVPADLGSFIKVVCTTKKDVHGTAIYPLHEGRYAIGEVEGNAKDGYTCTITIEAAGYVATYSNAKGEEHTLVHENDASKTVTLTWDSAAKDWSRPDDVTFEVKCETEIVPPTAPTLEQLPEISVTLHCGTTSAHREPTWSPLLENTYEISTPTLKNDVYTCTLTVKAEKYVGEYSSTLYRVGKHELDDDATKDITLTWDGQKWTAEKDGVTFKVKCKLYTVTYTDGVKNKVIFKDELHKDLAYGSDTPKFTGGTPKRTGYTFTGWSPKVADTVTGNVTYVAQWKSNSGKDNVPKTGSGEIAMILGSVLMFSFCGAAAVCVYDRKRRQR